MSKKLTKLISIALTAILILSCCFVTTIAAEEGKGTPITELEGKYKTQGRTEIENGALMLDWTAAGIEWNANCSGDVSITVNATRMEHADVEADGGLYFTVYVDGVMQAENLRMPETVNSSWTSNSTNYPFHITKKGESTFTIATDLPEGDHTFAIYNQTEANMGAFGVKSIDLNGTFLAPPAEKDLLIEVVGDSITAGHGVLNNFNVNAPLYEDATRGWPYLTAKALDADWSILAQSGITAIDGCGWGGANSVNMQDVYPYQRYYSNKTTMHDFANSREPDVIVLALGTNDCWTWNGTGGVTLTEAQKVSGFKQMLLHLRDRNPNAKIVWVHGMMTTNASSYILEAVSEMGGIANGYYTLDLPTNTAGGRGHPNLAVQATYAEKVSEFITRITTPVEQEDWEKPIEKPAYIGSGSEADPWLITNGAELYWAVTNENKGKYFKLSNDIILNEMTVDAANGTVSSETALKEWNTNGYPYFRGVLDGDNHVIKGLYIDETYTGTTSAWDIGYALISHSNGAVIKNLGIESAYVNGVKGAAAAFVGTVGSDSNHNTTFENCYVGADVYISGDQAGAFLAAGNGAGVIGGITNCYSLATVKASAYQPGGLYGSLWSFNSKAFVKNSYCIGKVTSLGKFPGTLENCFATDNSMGGTAISTANLKGDNARTNLAKLSAVFCMVDDGYPRLRTFVGRTNGEWSGFRSGDGMNGGGSAGDPYKIKTAEHLAHVIKNGGAGYYFRLENDIYLNDITKFDWETGTPAGNYPLLQWSGASFKGYFDGNGHTVYGLYIKKTTNDSAWGNTGDALFPSFDSGEIKNVGVDYAFVQAANNAAAIVGLAQRNTQRNINHCYAGSKVMLKGYNVGGIYGSGDAQLDIDSCYSLATLAGSFKQGGISGGWWSYSYSGVGTKHNITNCYTNASKVYYAVSKAESCVTITASGDAAINAVSLGDEFVRIGDGYPTLKVFTDLPENIPWNGLGDSSYIVDGRGTEAAPYLIENAAQLAHVIYNNGGKYYKLTNDIYLNDVSEGWLNRESNLSWITSPDYNGYGAGDTYFRGTLDGDGYVVYGLYYPDDTKCYSSALIPLFGSGTIKNIGIKDAYIIARDTAAGVVGITRPDSNKMKTVENCFADDSVYAEWTDSSMNGGAAGIVGYTSNGCTVHDVTIKNCWSAASLKSAAASSFRSNGIIGKSWVAYYTMENCYSIGYKPFAINSTSTISALGATAYKNVYTDDATAPYTAGTYTNLTTAQMTGKGALANMPGFSSDAWYAVDGKTPFLRSYGTAIFDANEDGKFEKASDITALRVGLISSPAKNGDVNKDGNIDICDLVKLSGK